MPLADRPVQGMSTKAVAASAAADDERGADDDPAAAHEGAEHEADPEDPHARRRARSPGMTPARRSQPVQQGSRSRSARPSAGRGGLLGGPPDGCEGGLRWPPVRLATGGGRPLRRRQAPRPQSAVASAGAVACLGVGLARVRRQVGRRAIGRCRLIAGASRPGAGRRVEPRDAGSGSGVGAAGRAGLGVHAGSPSGRRRVGAERPGRRGERSGRGGGTSHASRRPPVAPEDAGGPGTRATPKTGGGPVLRSIAPAPARTTTAGTFGRRDEDPRQRRRRSCPVR